MKTRIEELKELLKKNYDAIGNESEVGPELWQLIEERCKLSAELAKLTVLSPAEIAEIGC